MPYNVMTLTSTVVALFFGSMFNVLIGRSSEAEKEYEKKIKQMKPIQSLVTKTAKKVIDFVDDNK